MDCRKWYEDILCLHFILCSSNIWYLCIHLHSSPSTGLVPTNNVTMHLTVGLIAQLVEHCAGIASCLEDHVYNHWWNSWHIWIISDSQLQNLDWFPALIPVPELFKLLLVYTLHPEKNPIEEGFLQPRAK